jgi:hypothetical protein
MPPSDEAVAEYLDAPNEPSSARLAILAKIIFADGLGYKRAPFPRPRPSKL